MGGKQPEDSIYFAVPQKRRFHPGNDTDLTLCGFVVLLGLDATRKRP